MTAIRVSGGRGLTTEFVSPGDTLLVPDVLAQVTTVGNASITAAQMLTGELYRTGPTGAYTDTLDTSANLTLALAGNGYAGFIVPGLSFKLRLINSVAFAETITLGSGMVAGLGTVASVSASTWREFLFTFGAIQVPVTNLGTTTNGSANVTWYLTPGQTAEPIGVNPLSVNVVEGAFVSGTGVPAGTYVTGLIMGQGGTLGFSMSANASASGTVALSFSSLVTVHGLGSGTL